MSSASNAQRVGIWGASGSGKSSYAKQLLKTRKRIIFFDPMEEYGALAKCTVRTLEEVRAAMRANFGGFKIAFVPKSGHEARSLSAICKLAMIAQEPFKNSGKGSFLTLCVEEMNMAFPVHGGAAKCKGFAEVCSRGRHFGIEVYGLAQRIAEVDTRFRGNCDESVILRQQGQRDIQAAADVLGVDKGIINKIKNLEYVIGKQGEIIHGKVTFPKKRKK